MVVPPSCQLSAVLLYCRTRNAVVNEVEKNHGGREAWGPPRTMLKETLSPENANFTFWLFVFRPVCPNPVGRPARNVTIPHEWMNLGATWTRPLFLGSQSFADPTH